MLKNFFKNPRTKTSWSIRGKKKTCNFGEHLTLDGYGGSFKRLNDKKLVLKCLEELPGKIGMKILGAPHVYKADDNNIKDSRGWSGFVVVAESHLSIHTFPHRKFVSIDVYTCKDNLDRKFITGYFAKKFLLKDIETRFIRRGTKYPVEIVC